MLSPSGQVCRDTRGQPCVAGPAEAAPGTLVTHLQLSEKRRAEVGGRVLSRGLEDGYTASRHLKAAPGEVYTQEGALKGGPGEKGREVPGQG